jgi:sulfite reductase (ferredoxin)
MAERNKKSKIEVIKEGSRGLRGTIGKELDEDTGRFTKDSSQLLKFHGVYQQEDRDLRKERRAAGEEKAYQFMVRITNPGGGRLTPGQWVALDEVSKRFGDGTLRITSRQGIQFHGIGKGNLKSTIQFLNAHSVSTFGACGDGNRNTMACPVSSLRRGSHFDGSDWAARIAQRLSFRTAAYYEIWVDGEKAKEPEAEPLYGQAYLPRKFKIAIADPEDNCVDLFTNDIGILPELTDGKLEGFHVFVGGGLGSTHLKAETFPVLAQPLTFVSPGQLLDVVESIVRTQGDLGNREERRQARMKYLVLNLGLDRFRSEVEHRLGAQLPDPREHRLGAADRHFGWHGQRESGMNYLGIFVENGRIADRDGSKLKTGIRSLVEEFEPTIFLTPNHDLILADIPDSRVSEVGKRAEALGIVGTENPSLRTLSMACPALPTCGLAITEAERRLPGIISELEEAGLGDERITIRMSGCPNSCSRPPVAEIGLIGKSVSGYNLHVGGNPTGSRLAFLLREDVSAEQVPKEIASLIRVFRRQASNGEAFGDFCNRVGADQLQNWLEETSP